MFYEHYQQTSMFMYLSLIDLHSALCINYKNVDEEMQMA